METEDNVVEISDQQNNDAEYASAMEELLNENDLDALGRTVAGVLEFLAVRAVVDGPYYILNEDKTAITVVATNEEGIALLESLPEHYRSWDDEIEDDFITNADPGDEQDEPATESE